MVFYQKNPYPKAKGADQKQKTAETMIFAVDCEIFK